MILFNFLGYSVNHLIYSGSSSDANYSRTKTRRALSPKNEFFLTLCRLRCNLMEDDLAYRFKISQPTVSRIFTTWVNFLYYKLKEIPIWPSRGQVHLTMPEEFLCLYPNTCIIIVLRKFSFRDQVIHLLNKLLFLPTKIATLQKCWQELHLPELFRLYQTCMVVLYWIGNCL